jgi:hypothetical protein
VDRRRINPRITRLALNYKGNVWFVNCGPVV